MFPNACNPIGTQKKFKKKEEKIKQINEMLNPFPKATMYIRN